MKAITTTQKLKLAAAGTATLLILIVILQNMERVQTRILFMTVTMPRAVLLLITLLIGFALGLTAAYWLTRRKAKNSLL